MENRGTKTKKGIPVWLAIVLSAVILCMALAIAFLVMMQLGVVRCVPVEKPTVPTTAAATDLPTGPSATDSLAPESAAPVAEATPDAGTAGQPDPATTAPDTATTEAPTAEPTAAPTAEPTAVPTAAPTAVPTPKPTAVPDSFTFGGKKVKTGETKINGKKLGINGKKNKLKHITNEEVENLVALCPNLEELILDYCYMDDYEPLGELVKLKKLQLSSCGAGTPGNALTDIGWMEDLTALQSLDVAHNKIDDTEALAGMKKLTYLNMGDNPLTDEDLVPIGKLTNLENLYLYSLKKITDVKPLASLSKLTFLHIGYNSKLKDVKPLTSLSKLKYLRIKHTGVTKLDSFEKLTALRKVDLAKCPIPGDEFYRLKYCPKLETIVLDMGDYDAYLVIVDMIGDGFPLHISYNWSDS